MDIIFKNTNEDWQQYIEDFLPFLDRDTKFAYMKPHIISAQKDVFKTLGADTFGIAIAAFAEETPLELHEDILYHFRLPILIKAYQLYAPTNDLAHGNNGRKMRNKGDESNPFEWMINRDNQNQERSYYRELDNLIAFLEKFDVWRNSETYKKQKALFVHSTEILDGHFPVNSRLLLLKLQPGLKQAERKHIIPVIGIDLYEKLKSFILTTFSGDLEYYPEEAPAEPDEEEHSVELEPLEKELLELAQEATTYYALAWAMKRLKVTLFPEGILQQYIGDRTTSLARKTPENLETQLAAQEFNKDGDDVLVIIQNHIKDINTETMEDVQSILLDAQLTLSSSDKFFST